MNRFSLSTLVRGLFFSLLLIEMSATVDAQTLTFSDGATSATVPEGRDFASTAIGDPWDLSERSDLVWMFSTGFQVNPASGQPGIVVSGGKAQGTILPGQEPSVQIQFEGISGGFNLVEKTGVPYPIDASVFKRLSFRMKRSPETANPVDTFEARYFTGTLRTATTVGGHLALTRGFDSQNRLWTNQSPVADQAQPTYHIYKLDLDASNPFKYGANWAGLVRGLALRIASTDSALAGSTMELDWVRLTPRGTAVKGLSWSGFAGPVTLIATNGTGDRIQIFPDNSTNATTFGASGTFSWDYGFLASGAWTIQASDGATSRSITMVISPMPIFNFTEPDQTGGRDFATTAIGDPWDMQNAEDVTRNGKLQQIAGASYGAAGLTGTNTGDDSAVYLLDDSTRPPGGAVTIDANTFRHLSFTIEFDRKDLPSSEALGPVFGGVSRVIWRQAGKNGQALTNTQDILVPDGGPVTYSMDLGTFSKFGGDECSDCHFESGNGTDLWTGSIGTFRIDPFEATTSRGFRLSNVKVAADDEPTSTGTFLIRWTAFDNRMSPAPLTTSEGPAVADATVTLFYDTDTDPGSGLVQIAAGVPASAGQFAWNMAGLGPGRYFVYATVRDAAGNTQSRYSTGPVRIITPFIAPTDNDNDGLPDGWETKFGVGDPNADPDGDGVTNIQEYAGNTDPTLPNVWNLSEGATGFFNERLAIANPGVDPATVRVTFLREGGAAPIVQNYDIEAQRRITIDVNAVPGLANAAVSVVVQATAGGVVVERTMAWDARGGDLYGAHLGKAVQKALTSWYLADGDAKFADTYILFANAGGAPATVTATYLLPDSNTIVRTYTVPANARLTVFANEVPGLAGKEFSTVVQSSVPITVERAVYFSTAGRFWNGGHEAAATAAPAASWFVAEGRTGNFFDEYLAIANPQASAVTATINFLRPGGAVVTRTYTLPPTSRTTIRVDAIPGLEDTDVSASISATQPIVVERTMYWPDPQSNWYEAHNSAGVTQTGTKWAMAEGEVGGALGYETYILLANPGTNAADVRLTFLRQGNSPITMNRSVPPNSRLTVSAAEVVPSGDRFGVLVDSLNGAPIVVEHAIYWNGGGQFWGAGMGETAVRIR